MTKNKKKSPITAALLSIFVFPGLGYVYLRQLKFAIPVVLMSVSIITILATHAIRIAKIIVKQIQTNPTISGPIEIMELVHQTSENYNTWMIDSLSLLFPVLWIGSSIHGYLLGKKIRQEVAVSSISTLAEH